MLTNIGCCAAGEVHAKVEFGAEKLLMAEVQSGRHNARSHQVPICTMLCLCNLPSLSTVICLPRDGVQQNDQTSTSEF